MARAAVVRDSARRRLEWGALRRRAAALAAALSLLLCLGTLALWLRSHRVGDFGEFVGVLESHTGPRRASMRTAGLYSSQGRLGVGVGQLDFDANDPVFRHYPDGRRLVRGTEYCWERYPFTPIEGSPASRSWTGIDVRDRSWSGPTWTMTSRGVAVPHAFVAAATAIPPALWLLPRARRYLQRRRTTRMHRARLCPDCGYDLRATPDRCPECGTSGRCPTALA